MSTFDEDSARRACELAALIYTSVSTDAGAPIDPALRLVAEVIGEAFAANLDTDCLFTNRLPRTPDELAEICQRVAHVSVDAVKPVALDLANTLALALVRLAQLQRVELSVAIADLLSYIPSKES